MGKHFVHVHAIPVFAMMTTAIVKSNFVYSKDLEHPTAHMTLDNAFAKIMECMSETSNQCKVEPDANYFSLFILPFCY